jgi:hypothetical protein
MPKTITINSWRDLLRLSDEFPLHVFRGQADAKWELECSLHRSIEANYVVEDSDVVEYFLLREFRRGAKRYLSDVPIESDFVSWLSLMQHHGTPTRLIDFTYSFYVAAYFAIIGTVGDSALWIVDPEFVFRAAEIPRTEGRNGVKAEWESQANALANDFLARRLGSALSAAEKSEAKGILPVEPIQRHQRLAIQQGLFLMPFDAFGSLEQNLRPFVRRGERPVRKFVLKQSIRFDALEHFKSMNITAETLFPGIDGFARSLLHTQLA